MTDDRELLELAAKVGGQDWFRHTDGGLWLKSGGIWNPLVDDGDALRLAVKMRKFPVIETWSDGPWAYVYGHEKDAEPIGNDLCAATRRVIVKAAAEIGRAVA